MSVQYPTIILPTIAPNGIETELVADVAQHVSLSLPTEFLLDKTVYVYAIPTPAPFAPANLSIWIEMAASDVAAGYIQIGIATVLVAPGAATLQTATIPWATHSSYARIVVQCAAWVLGAWSVQVVYEAKTP